MEKYLVGAKSKTKKARTLVRQVEDSEEDEGMETDQLFHVRNIPPRSFLLRNMGTDSSKNVILTCTETHDSALFGNKYREMVAKLDGIENEGLKEKHEKKMKALSMSINAIGRRTNAGVLESRVEYIMPSANDGTSTYFRIKPIRKDGDRPIGTITYLPNEIRPYLIGMRGYALLELDVASCALTMLCALAKTANRADGNPNIPYMRKGMLKQLECQQTADGKKKLQCVLHADPDTVFKDKELAALQLELTTVFMPLLEDMKLQGDRSIPVLEEVLKRIIAKKSLVGNYYGTFIAALTSRLEAIVMYLLLHWWENSNYGYDGHPIGFAGDAMFLAVRNPGDFDALRLTTIRQEAQEYVKAHTRNVNCNTMWSDTLIDLLEERGHGEGVQIVLQAVLHEPGE